MNTHTSISVGLKRLLALSVAFAVLLLGATSSNATLISNGTFESSGGTDASTTTFTSWSERAGDFGSAAANAAASNTTSALAGTVSAMPNVAAGQLFQGVPGNHLQWSVSFDFAVLDNAAGSRTLNLLLRHNAGASEQINLRALNTTGQLQVFNGTAWVDLTGLIALETTNDVTAGWNGETPVVNSLTITGDYTTTPSYSVTLVNGSGTNSVMGITAFHAAPTAGVDGLLEIAFRRDTGTGTGANNNYLIDNVVVVPEPATAALLGLGGIGLAIAAVRRR